MMLPLVKLGSLAFREMSKPIAARLKYNADIHPKFRGLIIGIAQANHRLTTNMQRRVYGQATDIHIRPLNEEKAIQAAADLLGELFLFSAAGAAIIYEVQRSPRSEARKEEIRSQEIEAIEKKEEQLALEVQLMKREISDLEVQLLKQRISDLEAQLNFLDGNFGGDQTQLHRDLLELQLMKQKISERERQYSKWTRPGFRGFGAAQAAAQPAGTH